MKIKITCTEMEKLDFKNRVCDSIGCIFPFKCPEPMRCDECIEKNIEWEVTDDGCGSN